MTFLVQVNTDISSSATVSSQLVTTEFTWPIIMATACMIADIAQFTEVTQSYVNSLITGMRNLTLQIT